MADASALSDAAAARAASRPPPRRRVRLSLADATIRRILWQIVVVGLVVGLGLYLVSNASQNLAARRIATGFAFLGRVAGIPIGETLIPYDPAVNTYGRALLVGVLNTLRVAIVGIVLATVLGTAIGICRLSRNWLLAKLAAVYVEALRDIPLLLQLLFWYTLLQGLPPPRQSFRIGELVFLSNRGIKLPALVWDPAYGPVLLAGLAGPAVTLALWRLAERCQRASGRRPRVWPAGLCLVVLLPALIWVARGAPFQLDKPVLHGFNFTGGLTLSPEYGALLMGLVIYTASYIAEIVRAGIGSVQAGQWEAARALGLRRGIILRKIVLPQALRVIIPPITSQYLNLTKNSSLAVAIGYQDIVSIASTTLNQTGQAIEGIAVIMAVYLTISLTISLLMNWYNASTALVAR